MISTIVARGGIMRLLYDAPSRNLTDAAAEEPIQFSTSSMAVTMLLLLTALFCLVLFSLYARRFFACIHNAANSRHQNLQRRARPPYRGWPGLSSSASSSVAGLDAAAVRALPLLCYSGKGKEQDGCVVCLSVFVEKEPVKVIPSCSHVFHPACVDSWLMSHGSCPLCRCTELFGRSSRWDGPVGSGGGSLTVELGGSPEGTGSDEENREMKNEQARVGRSGSWRKPTANQPSPLSRSRSF